MTNRYVTKQPPISLTPAILFEDYPTVRVSYQPDNDTPAKKADLPYCPDVSDNERALRVISEFQDARVRLEIPYEDAYTKIREVLGGGLRHSWDMINNPLRPIPQLPMRSSKLLTVLLVLLYALWFTLTVLTVPKPLND